jgi:hypothetical protein
MVQGRRYRVEIDKLTEVLRPHLRAAMSETEFDIIPGEGALDISTDHWTIHLEGEGGFLAIDEEPADMAAFRAARRAVMSEKVEQALAAADRDLGGALSEALTTSGDPFTLDFVDAIVRLRADG